MKTLPNKKSNGTAIWMFLAGILILVYIGLMIVLFLSHLKIVFEPPLLLPIMNTIFAALIHYCFDHCGQGHCEERSNLLVP